MESINKICEKCRFAKHESYMLCRCINPTMPQSLWDYTEPSIEAMGELESALHIITQSDLRNNNIRDMVAPLMANEKGECKGYEESDTPPRITAF